MAAGITHAVNVTRKRIIFVIFIVVFASKSIAIMDTIPTVSFAISTKNWRIPPNHAAL
jgi:hypothetical protein